MAELALNSDEVILHRTQALIVCGVRYEAVLTKKRLILVTSGTGTVHDAVPMENIRLARSGINRLREPVITLSTSSPGGEKRTIDLIFARLDGNQNNADAEKCIAILREQNVPVETGLQAAGPVFSGSGQRLTPSELGGEEPASRPEVPDWTVFGTSRKVKKPLTMEGPQRSPLVIIAAALFIVVMLVIGLTFAGQMISAKNATVNRSVTGPDITVTIPVSASTAPASLPQETSGPVSSAPALAVPMNGVWVLISYTGNYSGDIGAMGRKIVVNGSGDQLYKVPVENAMIEGSIEKADGSADTLDVGIYNGGELVSQIVTDKPWGVADIHVMVGPAIGNPIVTDTPVIKTTVSPYASLPETSIPASGVWVRVNCMSNFTGSIRANGFSTTVNGTGDQLYQLPVTTMILDSSVEKQEGTADTLIIVVYNNGNPISRASTSIPFGVADLHTTVQPAG